jgi:hypothetical protein
MKSCGSGGITPPFLTWALGGDCNTFSKKTSGPGVFSILSRAYVTINGVWIGNWMYWPLTDHNHK